MGKHYFEHIRMIRAHKGEFGDGRIDGNPVACQPHNRPFRTRQERPISTEQRLPTVKRCPHSRCGIAAGSQDCRCDLPTNEHAGERDALPRLDQHASGSLG